MNLIVLERKLKEAGYSPYLHEDLRTLYNCIADASGKPEFETMCQVRMENGRYSCLCFGIEKDVKTIFDTSEQLIVFIKQKYPLRKDLSF